MKKLKEKLNEKLRKNGGFTLVEMLIVVAIIAILVAVSIPLVGTSLEKAREATDDANLRAAKGEAMIMYMNDQIDGTATLKNGMKYNNVAGTFTDGTVDGYSVSKDVGPGKWVVVKLTGNENQPITVAWSE